MLQNTLRKLFRFIVRLKIKACIFLTSPYLITKLGFVCVLLLFSLYRTDFRPTWNLKQSEPIAGNYYPINSRAFIKVCVYVCVCVREKCFY